MGGPLMVCSTLPPLRSDNERALSRLCSVLWFSMLPGADPLPPGTLAYSALLRFGSWRRLSAWHCPCSQAATEGQIMDVHLATY